LWINIYKCIIVAHYSLTQSLRQRNTDMTTITIKHWHPTPFTSLQEIVSRIWTLMQLTHDRARQRQQLAQLSSEQLMDMGIDRKAALAESAKPFWRS